MFTGFKFSLNTRALEDNLTADLIYKMMDTTKLININKFISFHFIWNVTEFQKCY